MRRIFPSLFLLWAIINSGRSRNQPVLGLNEVNSTKEAATGLEKHGQSERGKDSGQHIWSAAATLFLTSLLAASFTALKIFVAQTLLVSKISLAGATLLAVKAAYDHLKFKFQNSGPLPWDSYPSGFLVTTPWAWEPIPLTGPPQDTLPQDQDEQDLRELSSGNANTRTHVGLADSDRDASVRSDRLRQRYPPNLSLEYDTIIKKTTYLN